jgi:hypothetical protein
LLSHPFQAVAHLLNLPRLFSAKKVLMRVRRGAVVPKKDALHNRPET